MVRIFVVSGIIGVGKTTLLKLLEKRGYTVLPERVDYWQEKGWLQEFYKDREREVQQEALSFQLLVYDTGIENVEQVLKKKKKKSTKEVCHGIFNDPDILFIGANGAGTNNNNASPFSSSLQEEEKEEKEDIIFVERYLYDQLLFWKTQNATKMQDESYMRIWRRWRDFIPEPSGYILLHSPTAVASNVEARGRPEELKASRDGDFDEYQKLLAKKHAEYFQEGTARPPEAPEKGFPCLHVNIEKYPYHERNDTGIVEHIEEWINDKIGF